MLERRFFNPYAEIQFSQNRLPHRQQDGITYFVTFRLADSLPTNLLDQWRTERKAWMTFHPEPWSDAIEQEYHRRFTAQIEDWLDAGHGKCLLKAPLSRRLVENVFQTLDGTRYQLHAWVIMPNHVHALFSLAAGESLESVIKGWKGTSGRAINKHSGAKGTIWMKDYFDRMIRDAEHFWRCARYIHRNPVKAKLNGGAFTLFESSHVRDVLDGKANG